MTVRKEQVVAGTKVVVTNSGKGINSPVTLMPNGSFLEAHCYPPVGEVVAILAPPKKSDGINFVKVSWKEKQFLAYYAHIRYSCDVLDKSCIGEHDVPV